MIDIKDSITLSDNNEYLVCGKVNKDNKIYILFTSYLVFF